MNKICCRVVTAILAFALSFALAGEEKNKEHENKNVPGKKGELKKIFPSSPEMGKRGGMRRGVGRGMTHHRRRGRPMAFPGKFTPEEYAELNRLSMAGDRAGFGKKLRELRRKYASEEDKKVFLLEEKYHAEKSGKEKALIRKELLEAVRVQVKKRNDFTLKQIKAAEEKIRRLKQRHAQNVKNADKNAEKITEFLCTPPAERKKFRRGPGHKPGAISSPAGKKLPPAEKK